MFSAQKGRNPIGLAKALEKFRYPVAFLLSIPELIFQRKNDVQTGEHEGEWDSPSTLKGNEQ